MVNGIFFLNVKWISQELFSMYCYYQKKTHLKFIGADLILAISGLYLTQNSWPGQYRICDVLQVRIRDDVAQTCCAATQGSHTEHWQCPTKSHYTDNRPTSSSTTLLIQSGTVTRLPILCSVRLDWGSHSHSFPIRFGSGRQNHNVPDIGVLWIVWEVLYQLHANQVGK